MSATVIAFPRSGRRLAVSPRRRGEGAACLANVIPFRARRAAAVTWEDAELVRRGMLLAEILNGPCTARAKRLAMKELDAMDQGAAVAALDRIVGMLGMGDAGTP